jgi:hypothetical protein
MKRIGICSEFLDFHDFWINFHNHVKHQAVEHNHKKTTAHNVYAYSRTLEDELKKYGAKFFYLDMCIEFDTEHNATLFLLEWS